MGRGEDDRPSLLTAAAYAHDWEAVERLQATAGELSIHEAAIVGDVTAMRAAVRHAPEMVEAVAADGFRPLHLAAYFARPAAVVALLSLGADPDAVAAQPARLRPLHAATAGRDVAVVAALLGAGAQPDRTQRGGFTPLMAASRHGDVAIVRLLLASGAATELADEDGRTAADHATGDAIALV